jgi:hypothetical protein
MQEGLLARPAQPPYRIALWVEAPGLQIPQFFQVRVNCQQRRPIRTAVSEDCRLAGVSIFAPTGMQALPACCQPGIDRCFSLLFWEKVGPGMILG